ncbi:Organic hydroperoxide resistance transcriptional regulator, MarR-family protein [Salinisphaera shabanensis T35B1]|jgi:DNA-binding MarR family transcriptional regulator|uniref:Transcriptional regulator MarR family protein n=1 Tax=Salinisphaera shabanensis E1L3A TaxID=1033802 RepID=U2ENA8_9GAMM|nr:MarR family transcriptional regulator [Salinisphaera shabanensis]ERJ19345.1 Transcriptional regulator MarR family protein [Salinisphaera shabanensis E1L3A]|tara:strand:+ start:303 stop:767 length:465 start_codon:yes stop_codon:yes gene_type:complete
MGASPAQNEDNEQDLRLLDEQLCFSLYTATHRIIRAYRPLLEPLGLTYVQYLVMLVLWEKAPRSVGELGSELHLDSGTLTPLLKRMEQAGLVVRERDSEDERRVLISVTDEGLDLQHKSSEIHEAMLCQVELTRPEALALRERIMALADTLRQA